MDKKENENCKMQFSLMTKPESGYGSTIPKLPLPPNPLST